MDKYALGGFLSPGVLSPTGALPASAPPAARLPTCCGVTTLICVSPPSSCDLSLIALSPSSAATYSAVASSHVGRQPDHVNLLSSVPMSIRHTAAPVSPSPRSRRSILEGAACAASAPLLLASGGHTSPLPWT